MIYLDNAATSFPKATGVAEALARQVSSIGGNPGRTSHTVALDADRLLFETREAVSRVLGVADSRRIIFTKNATEALNTVLLGSIKPGALVATSSLEHNAVMRPLRWLEKTRGVEIILVRCDEGGRPDIADLDAAARRRPDVAVFTMASNVTGAFLPWQEIAHRFRVCGSIVCLDGSQAIGHAPIGLPVEDIDFMCFPGHKGLLGPSGTGGFYIAGDEIPEPLIRGGTGSHSDSELQPEDLPDRFEAGTQNLSGAAGLLASASFLSATGLDVIRSRESALTECLLAGFRGIAGLHVYGPSSGTGRTPIVSVSATTPSLDEIAHSLDLRGVAVRMGLHCAPAAHRSIGTFSSGGTIRFSPGYFTTEAEIGEAIEAMEDIVMRGELYG